MKNLLLIVLMSISVSTFAQRYVLFNPNCMERLKYDVINGYGGDSYIVYAIELNDRETIYLEVGKESEKTVSRIARAVVTCNSSSFSKSLVNRINSDGGEQYEIVLKEGSNSFNVSPVIAASYFSHTDESITYIGKDYAFTYNNWRNSPSDNLADPTYGNGSVYFVGNSPYECFNAYTFSVSPQRNSNVSTDLTIVPELGVLEYRTNLSGANGSKRLATVNAKTFRSIVQDRCAGRDYVPLASAPANRPPNATTVEDERARGADRIEVPITTTTDRTTLATATTDNYGMIARREPIVRTDVYDNRDRRLAEPVSVVTTPQPQNGVHIVAKGETLYRIAKNNNVTVEQLKAWNGLRSNEIFPGTRLLTTMPSNGLTNRGVGVTTLDDRRSTTNNSLTPAWERTDGYHIFKRGETVAGIANMYGYTEARFRDLNNLRPTDILPIGYRLKTSDCEENRTSVNPDFRVDNRRTVQPPMTTTRGDEFSNRGRSTGFDDGFDDEFRESVRTPAPYGQTPSNRINTSRTSDDYRDAARTNIDGTPLSISFSGRPQLHLVKENETLYSIARKYNTTVARLAQVNDLDAREIVLPGQSIYVQ